MVLNKSEVKMVMEQIEKKLQSQRAMTVLEYQNKPAWNVLREMWNDGRKQFIFNNATYRIQFNPSHTTIANRSSCDEFTVSRFTAKETFDVDELMSKREIHVRDWTGGDAAKKCGLSDNTFEYDEMDKLISVIRVIMTNTDLNIMIQRHDTGDVTIWVDDKRFTQR